MNGETYYCVFLSPWYHPDWPQNYLYVLHFIHTVPLFCIPWLWFTATATTAVLYKSNYRYRTEKNVLNHCSTNLCKYKYIWIIKQTQLFTFFLLVSCSLTQGQRTVLRRHHGSAVPNHNTVDVSHMLTICIFWKNVFVTWCRQHNQQPHQLSSETNVDVALPLAAS